MRVAAFRIVFEEYESIDGLTRRENRVEAETVLQNVQEEHQHQNTSF